MSARLSAVVLAALLVASALLVVGQGAAGRVYGAVGTAAESAASPAVTTTLTPTIYNGSDVVTTTFYAGVPNNGTLFFYVKDSQTTDKFVNITITDPNATRDGISSPAFQYEAGLNMTSHSYDSFLTGIKYAFPASLPYNEVWTANFSESATNYIDVPLVVLVYSVSLSTSVPLGRSVLPGQPIDVFWNLTSVSNNATPYTRATNVYITGSYDANGTTKRIFTAPKNVALTPASAGFGEWKGVVPGNAEPFNYLDFEVYAYTNVSGVTIQNESAYIDVEVGELLVTGFGVTANLPPRCVTGNSEPFTAGSTLAVCISVYSYDGSYTPAAGLPVTLTYWNGTKHVAPAGAPTSLTTNATGKGLFTFVADAPPFAESIHTAVFNAVNYSVTAPGAYASGHTWTISNYVHWELVPPTPGFGTVEVSLDKTQYYVGGTATATWSILSSNASETGTIAPVAWALYSVGELSYTALNTTAETGTFTVPITSAMLAVDYFCVAVFAANATESFAGYGCADILAPTLLLNSATAYYSAGTTTSATPVLEGVAAGTPIQFLVVGYWAGNSSNLSMGSTTNNTPIPISIPSKGPPTAVSVFAWATAGGVVVATAERTLSLEYGYTIQLGVTTPSSYSDGSYQPGQTVTLSYAIVPVGGAPEPALVFFYLFAQGYSTVYPIENVGPSGTVSFTIPSNAVQGSLELSLELESDLNGPCIPNDNCYGNTTVPINPSPSVLSYEVGAGSGVTVGWLIVLVLVIVVAAALAVLLLRRRGGRGRMGGSPSAGGSTTTPSEWKAPGQGSSAPPPSGGSPPSPPAPPP